MWDSNHPPSAGLLPFQRTVLDSLLEDDALCVLAPGLGLQQVVAALIRLQQQPPQRPTNDTDAPSTSTTTTTATTITSPAVVLGCTPWQRDMIKRELIQTDLSFRQSPDTLPPEVTNDILSAERERLYRSCPCLFVTTRIFVVDLLSGRVPPQLVAGVIVINAHKVTDVSGEGFALRLLKDGNPAAWVRAFTDAPVALSSEFSGVEKVMNALRVKKLHLWPRFQVQVQTDLEARPPELIELSQPLTTNMAAIYEAISLLMDACVKDLRKTNKVDTTELTVSSGLFRAFDESIRRQLGPIWHTVSPKTRQIVADLRTLRTLATYLLRFDPVTYLAYLDNLRVTEGIKSVWLFHSAAHAIFESAKARVYQLQKNSHSHSNEHENDTSTVSIGLGKGKKRLRQQDKNGTSSNSGSGSGRGEEVLPVLEQPPKWHLLCEVVREIQEERWAMMEKAETEDNNNNNDNGDGSGGVREQSTTIMRNAAKAPILIVCADIFTAKQLEQVVSSAAALGNKDEEEKEEEGKEEDDDDDLASGNGSFLLRRLYAEYLQRKLDAKGGGSRKRNNDSGDTGAYNAGPPSLAPQDRMMGGYRPGEEQAIIKEAKSLNVGNALGSGALGGKKKKKKSDKGGTATTARQAAAAAAAVAAKRGRGGRGRGRRGGKTAADAAADAISLAEAINNYDDGDEIGPNDNIPPSSSASSQPGNIHFIALDSHNDIMFLWEHSPTFVILYDPEPSFTRQLELYKAQRPGIPLRVYVLRYEDSVEMDKFQAAVARERNAFEGLIKAKEIMILPPEPPSISSNGNLVRSNTVGAGRLMASLTSEDMITMGEAANALTRRAGGRIGGKLLPRRVVIDVREFRSSLPAVLYSKGMEVVPLTLEVGDYVLSPEICVERKSIPDLRGSLQSGRLYSQAEAMTKYYKTAILLIEFEGDRAFALQAASEMTDTIQLQTFMSRIALLCLHFPRLRLIWSRSLHATADIFLQLKANHEEPDPVAAATIGIPMEANNNNGNTSPQQLQQLQQETVVNQAAIDLLRCLPGVREGNMRPLMRAAGSLKGLVNLSLDDLKEIMGGHVAANKLREFLDQECQSLFKAL